MGTHQGPVYNTLPQLPSEICPNKAVIKNCMLRHSALHSEMHFFYMTLSNICIHLPEIALANTISKGKMVK